MTIVVGDIHGDLNKLNHLLSLLPTDQELVFLGDYIDRGPESAGVISRLLEVRSWPGGAKFLIGNHEIALLNYLEGGDAGPYFSLGGDSTIRSYVTAPSGNIRKQLRTHIPREHLDFLKSLVDFVEQDQWLLSHAGYDPNDPEDRSRASMTSGHPEIFRRSGVLGKLVVCGHYVQRSGEAFVSSDIICIDTGCGSAGGPLTAVGLPERAFFSTM